MLFSHRLYLLQQSFNMGESVNYSVGIVVICLAILIGLWLPGILKER
ncbi:MAG: hypothetical protein HC778_03275 [Chamaesiphon sp. CSU_1_12]|nr:hypothetical protein [Chamaesiphon sp. CSU_1_12]